MPQVPGDKSLSNQEFFGFAGVECNLTTLRSFVATAADLWRTNFEVMTCRTTLATLLATRAFEDEYSKQDKLREGNFNYRQQYKYYK